MVKVEGTDDIYDLTPAPGIVTEEGTFLNTENLLKDTTAALLGGNANMVPDEAFVALKNLIENLTPGKIGAARIVYGTVAGTGSDKFTVNSPFYPQLIVLSGIYVRSHDNVHFYTCVLSGPVAGVGLDFYNWGSSDYIYPAATTVTESNGVFSSTVQVENTLFYDHQYNYVVIG